VDAVGDERAQAERDRPRSLSLEPADDLRRGAPHGIGVVLRPWAEADHSDAALSVGPVEDRELLPLALDLLARPGGLDETPGRLVLLLERPRERVVLLGALEDAARRDIRRGREAVAAVDLDLHGPSVDLERGSDLLSVDANSGGRDGEQVLGNPSDIATRILCDVLEVYTHPLDRHLVVRDGRIVEQNDVSLVGELRNPVQVLEPKDLG